MVIPSLLEKTLKPCKRLEENEQLYLLAHFQQTLIQMHSQMSPQDMKNFIRFLMSFLYEVISFQSPHTLKFLELVVNSLTSKVFEGNLDILVEVHFSYLFLKTLHRNQPKHHKLVCFMNEQTYELWKNLLVSLINA